MTITPTNLQVLTDKHQSWKPTKGINREAKSHSEQTALNQEI